MGSHFVLGGVTLSLGANDWGFIEYLLALIGGEPPLFMHNRLSMHSGVVSDHTALYANLKHSGAEEMY